MVPEGIPSLESILPSSQEQEVILAGEKTQENKESLIPPEIHEKLLRVRWNEAKGNQQEELQKSEDFISQLPVEEQNVLYDIIQASTGMVFGNYIKENGYIINPVTFQAFQAKFGNTAQKSNESEKIFAIQSEEASAQVEEANAQVEEANAQVEEANAQVEEKEAISEKEKKIFEGNKKVFLSHLDTFSAIPDFQEVVQRLQNANTENPQEIEELNEALKAALAQNFEKVTKIYEELGRQENPADPFASAIFQDFEKQVVAIDPGFSSRIETYKAAPKTIGDVGESVHQAQIVAGVGSEDFQKYGNIIEAKNDGQTTRMDIGNVPPTRSIALEGSNFSLETDVPIGDFYPAISHEGLAYEKTVQENTPKIQALEALQGQEIQDFLQSDDFNNVGMTLQNAIFHISRMIGLPTEVHLEDILGKSLSSKDDLKSTLLADGILSGKKQELEKEISGAEKKYQTALRTHMQAYREHLKESDEITKKALQICKNAGLDMCDIPYILSQLSGSLVPDIDISFNKGNIDLKTLNIGQALTEAGNEKVFAEYIYRIVNKIAFGSPEGKVGEDGINIGFDLAQVKNNPLGQYKTNTQLRDMFQDTGVLNAVSGTINKSTIMTRLIQQSSSSQL